MIADEAAAITEVRRIISEVSEGFYLTADITAWLQMAVIDITTKAHCYELSYDVTLVADQWAYTTPATIASTVKALAALYTSGTTTARGLVKILVKSINHQPHQTPGPTFYFSHFESSIIVWPPPTAAEVTDTAKIKIYSAQVSDDITKLPDSYRFLACKFAAGMAFSKDKKFAASGFWMGQYYNDVRFQRVDLQERGVDAREMYETPERAVIRQ